MRIRILAISIFLSLLACNNEKPGRGKAMGLAADSEMVFNREKWMIKEGKDYPFREYMLNNIVYNDTVRTLNKNEILNLFGEPDRINEDYMYYMVAQKRIFDWPLHTKTMVIKFTEDNSVDWIKIHS